MTGKRVEKRKAHHELKIDKREMEMKKISIRIQSYLLICLVGLSLDFSAFAIPAEGTKIMVSGPSPYAVQIAQIVAEQGGNVVDVAVAMGLALSVTSPYYAALGVAGLVNLALGVTVLLVGKKNKSVALEASGKHLMSDFWTSVGVIGGLGLVEWTGLRWIDSVTAILAGMLLVWQGFKLVRKSVGGLLDEEDLEVLNELEEIFTRLATNGIIQIHHVKVIRSGAFHHIDAHLVIPEFWDITQAHQRTTKFERQVISNYPYGGEMNFHLDPCRRAYCQVCDLSDCPVRQEKFRDRMPVKLEHLRSRVEPKEFCE